MSPPAGATRFFFFAFAAGFFAVGAGRRSRDWSASMGAAALRSGGAFAGVGDAAGAFAGRVASAGSSSLDARSVRSIRAAARFDDDRASADSGRRDGRASAGSGRRDGRALSLIHI